MANGEIKKKHHYLPRFYLAGFISSVSDRLWVYEKGRLDVRPSSPEAEGCQKYYHAFITDDGNRDTNTIEDYFQTIETNTGLLFKKIHQREKMTDKDRKELALFISFMFTRVPLFRSEIEKMASEHIEETGLEAAINDFKISLTTIDKEIGINPNISETDLKNLPSKRGAVFSLTQIFHVALDYFPKLLKLKWRFLFSNQNYSYITSDNPLYFFSPSANASLAHDDFHNDDIEITLPLSKDVALVAKRDNIQPGYGSAKTQTIKHINKNTVISAKTYVYSSTMSDSLNNLVQKNKDIRPYMVMNKVGSII